MGQMCFVLGIVLAGLALVLGASFEGWLYFYRKKLRAIFKQKYRS